MPTRFDTEQIELAALRKGDSIAHTAFIRCTLLGPIHLNIGDHVDFNDCSFRPSPADCVEVVEKDKRYVGLVKVFNCSFDNCTFDDVKLMVPPGHALLEGE